MIGLFTKKGWWGSIQKGRNWQILRNFFIHLTYFFTFASSMSNNDIDGLDVEGGKENLEDEYGYEDEEGEEQNREGEQDDEEDEEQMMEDERQVAGEHSNGDENDEESGGDSDNGSGF